MSIRSGIRDHAVTPLDGDREDRLQLQGSLDLMTSVDAVEKNDNQNALPRMQSTINAKILVIIVHFGDTSLLQPCRRMTLFFLTLSPRVASQLGPPRSSSITSK